jgi:cystathionine beta-lyase/cystathionine gamma-synthase
VGLIPTVTLLFGSIAYARSKRCVTSKIDSDTRSKMMLLDKESYEQIEQAISEKYTAVFLEVPSSEVSRSSEFTV